MRKPKKATKKQTRRRPKTHPLPDNADSFACIHYCQTRKQPVTLTITSDEMNLTEHILHDAHIPFTRDGNRYTLTPPDPTDTDCPYSTANYEFYGEDDEPAVVNSTDAAQMLGISLRRFCGMAQRGLIQPYYLDDDKKSSPTYLVDEVLKLTTDSINTKPTKIKEGM